MANLLLVISVLLSTNLISYVVGRKGGLPESISAMVFDMKHPWLWSVWLWAVTFTLAPSLLNALPDGCEVFGFFTLAFLLFTGIVPLFDVEHRKWHYPLAFLAGVCSQACVWFICPWFLLLWIVMLVYIVAGISAMNDKIEDGPFDGKGVIIAELIAIFSVFGSILVKMFF